MTSEPFDVAAWNLSRLAGPPDSSYERQENAISPAAIAWAEHEGQMTDQTVSYAVPGGRRIVAATVRNLHDITAICDDGSVWVLYYGEWSQRGPFLPGSIADVARIIRKANIGGYGPAK